MSMLTNLMQSPLASTSWPSPGSTALKVITQSPVVALSNDNVKKKISATVADQQPAEYDMVFNTTAMGPLQHMNLEGLGLPGKILTGIRTLSYDRATKVAIRFSRPWWSLHKRPTHQQWGLSLLERWPRQPSRAHGLVCMGPGRDSGWHP